MNKEIFTKIKDNTFKRIIEVEKEDIFTLSELKTKKKDLEEKIIPLQKRLDRTNHIIEEIKKVDK